MTVIELVILGFGVCTSYAMYRGYEKYPSGQQLFLYAMCVATTVIYAVFLLYVALSE